MKGGRNNLDLSKDQLAIGRLGLGGWTALELTDYLLPGCWGMPLSLWVDLPLAVGSLVTENGVYLDCPRFLT